MTRLLLLQARDPDDPMLEHEVSCFQRKLPNLSRYQLATHNLVFERPQDGLLNTVEAVLVGGSGKYGVVDNRESWFPPALDFLGEVLTADLPLFCSCWGHQALAVALGGEVIHAPDRREVGTLPIHLTEDGRQDPLYSGFPTPFQAQLGHNDQVSLLPEQAVLLASSQLCPVQSYRLRNKPVYATQFHPELDRSENLDRARYYFRAYGLEAEGVAALEEGFLESPQASGLVSRFLALHDLQRPAPPKTIGDGERRKRPGWERALPGC